MLDYLDRDAAIESLRTRLSKLDKALTDEPAIPPHGGKLSIDLAIDHLQAIRRADRTWLLTTIERLEREQTAS